VGNSSFIRNSFVERKIGIIVSIVLVSILVYGNAIKCNFVLDDNYIIKENSNIRSLRNILLIFSSRYWDGVGSDVKKHRGFNAYRPVAIASFAIDYWLWKLNPMGYHLHNVLIHILNSLLFFFILVLLLRNNQHLSRLVNQDLIILFLPIIFAVHPIHTEAVTSVVGRADILATFFVLAAYLTYIKFLEKKYFWFYVISVVSFALALLSKEMAITLIGMIFLHDIFSENFAPDETIKQSSGYRLRRLYSHLRYYLGYLAMAGLYMGVRILLFGRIGFDPTRQFFFNKSVAVRFFTMLKVIAYYVKSLVIPYPLHVEYGDYSIIKLSNSLSQPDTFLSLCVLVLLLGLMISLYKYMRLASFGLAFFFLTLFPVSHIIPIGALMGERFLYLPSVGFVLLFSVFFSRYQKRFRILSSFFLILIVIIVGLFSLVTIRRNVDWRSEHNLWASTVQTTPENHIAHFNLGVVYSKESRLSEAILHYKKSIELSPAFREAYLGLSNAYMELNLCDETESILSEATRIFPGEYRAFYNLANTYLYKKDLKLAVSAYRKSLEINPQYADAYGNLAIALLWAKDFADAKIACNKAIELESGNALFHNTLGAINFALGNVEESITAFEKALAIQPGYEEAQKNLEEAKQRLLRR